MANATDDLKAAQAAIQKSVLDVVAFINNLAGTIQGGVSATDAESIASDLKNQAAALEAAITPAPAPTPTPTPAS